MQYENFQEKINDVAKDNNLQVRVEHFDDDTGLVTLTNGMKFDIKEIDYVEDVLPYLQEKED